MIELRDVGFGYEGSSGGPVLRHVTLAIDEGELVLVSGRTGVGKSTLLGVVTGLVPRFSGGTLAGDVLVDGRSVVHQPPRERSAALVERSGNQSSFISGARRQRLFPVTHAA